MVSAFIPDAPFGVNGGASATLADMSVFGGVDGVNDGESTLNFPRPMLRELTFASRHEAREDAPVRSVCRLSLRVGIMVE